MLTVEVNNDKVLTVGGTFFRSLTVSDSPRAAGMPDSSRSISRNWSMISSSSVSIVCPGISCDVGAGARSYGQGGVVRYFKCCVSFVILKVVDWISSVSFSGGDISKGLGLDF